jgi:hypothetical protein
MEVGNYLEAFSCFRLVLDDLFFYLIDFLLEVPACRDILSHNEVKSKDFLRFFLEGLFEIWGIEAAH